MSSATNARRCAPPWRRALALGALFLALAAQPAGGHHITMRPGFFGHVVVDLALAPWDEATLYVAAFGQGVFLSPDGGRSWRGLNEGLAETSVRGMAFGPGRILYLATDQGGFRRAPGGPWEPLPGLRGRSVRVLRVGARAGLYAGTEAGVFASPDGGRSWEPRSRGLAHPDVRDLAADPARPGRLYAGTFGGVFRSVDGGLSWQAASSGLADLRVRALALDSRRPGRLLAGTALGGVFESPDGGESWRPRNKRLFDTSVMALALDEGGALYAGTRGGLFRLPAGGELWEYVRVERTPLSMPAIAAGRRGNIFVTSGGEVFESRDGGKSWAMLTPGAPRKAATQSTLNVP